MVSTMSNAVPSTMKPNQVVEARKPNDLDQLLHRQHLPEMEVPHRQIWLLGNQQEPLDLQDHQEPRHKGPCNNRHQLQPHAPRKQTPTQPGAAPGGPKPTPRAGHTPGGILGAAPYAGGLTLEELQVPCLRLCHKNHHSRHRGPPTDSRRPYGGGSQPQAEREGERQPVEHHRLVVRARLEVRQAFALAFSFGSIFTVSIRTDKEKSACLDSSLKRNNHV